MRPVSLLAICFLILAGCYRMPQEGEVSVLPLTNNPTITHPEQHSPIPGLGM